MKKAKLTAGMQDAVTIYRALERESLVAMLARLDAKTVARLLKSAASCRDVSLQQLEEVCEQFDAALHAISENSRSTVHAHGSDANGQTIELLAQLEDTRIQQLLAKVNTACWAPALKRASQRTREHVLKNMAPPVAAILQTEIRSLVNVSAAKVQSAVDEVLAAIAQPTDGPPIKKPHFLKQQQRQNKKRKNRRSA